MWLPIRKMKGRPEVYILVSFGLDHRVESPRVVEAAETSPRRWTHHVLVQDAAEIDAELMGWIEASYQFSIVK